MAHEPGLHDELVLIDQSQLRQRQRELHASDEQSLARLPLELPNGLLQIPAHELRVPIHPVQGARHDVLLRRVDRPGEGFHPIRPRSHPPPRPEGGFHHFVCHPPKEESVGPVEVLDRVTMQVFVRDDRTMIAAPVQRDVDGIPEWSHAVPYCMTSSARSSRDGGIVSPRAFAVLRLITSSNFVGCSTGRSAGLAPFRILSTNTATRRSVSSVYSW